MEANTKKIVGTLAVVAAIGGGFFLFTKGKKLLAGAKMNFALLGFRIHKLTLQEVQFAVKLRCYNPTNAPITLAINQVVAKYKGSDIAFSTPDIRGLTIPAGKTQEPEITFQVPYLNLMGKGLSMAALQNTEQLKADMTFTLTISINGETITTTQNLTDENMNGLASGQLGIVSGPRNTKDGRQFNHLIKKAAGTDKFIKNGNVLETVESCINIIADHYREVEELAKNLQADSVKNTCRNIFNFAYTFLQYQKDEDGTEQIRTPARSWLDGQVKFKQQGDTNSGIDCDDYSIFCGSILKCLGIPFKFRITKYDGKSYFQHIYVFVPAQGDSEDEIIIDPVLSKFDYQKPYSFEKSDFNMSPLQMVGGIRGINGLTGTLGLGLPIYALSGLDMDGGRIADEDHTELMAIVSGVDFEDTMNGLGDAEDATLNYLRRTRDFLLKNKENKGKMSHIQNPDQFINMIDQAIKFWHTPQRDKVLDKLVAIEDKLAENGFIKYDIDGIEGIEDWDDDEPGTAGLGRSKKRKGRFFSAIKKIGKKVGSVAKKAVKAIVRFNPLSIAIRNGLLAALRLNMFGIAKKLQYAYLPDNLASKYNIDPAKLADLKKRHAKVKKLFNGLQGKEKNLRNAILKGAKQKSPDFSINGIEGIIAGLQGLEAIGALAQLGDLGVAATAASVGAATGVLAKIKSWLKPVSNIFTKAKEKIAARKQARQQAAQQQNSTDTNQDMEQNLTPMTPIAPSVNYSIPNTNSESSSPPYLPSPTPTNMARTPTTLNPQKGISKGAKVGIGLGLAALIGTGAYFMFRNKGHKPKTTTRTKESPEKKSLGRIELS
jgi:LEA14-like dessication related protein